MIKKVIVIDDEVDMTRLISVALNKLAIENQTYTDPEKALREILADDTLPDGIFLDLLMPKLDGKEFLTKLFEHERFHKVPVVLITAAKELPADLTTAFTEFPVAVIRKPLDVSAIITTIANLRAKFNSDK